MSEETMTTEEVNQGFAVALSKAFGPGVMIDLLEHATDAPPHEPTVFCVSDLIEQLDHSPTHLLHRHDRRFGSPGSGVLCSTPRIRGSCSRCGCGEVLWDDR